MPDAVEFLSVAANDEIEAVSCDRLRFCRGSHFMPKLSQSIDDALHEPTRSSFGKNVCTRDVAGGNEDTFQSGSPPMFRLYSSFAKNFRNRQDDVILDDA